MIEKLVCVFLWSKNYEIVILGKNKTWFTKAQCKQRQKHFCQKRQKKLVSFYEAKNYKIVNFYYVLSRKYTQNCRQVNRGSKLPCASKSMSQPGPKHTTSKAR